ncbi:unnamed protein product, partial [Ectocarpus fasciculatus]
LFLATSSQQVKGAAQNNEINRDSAPKHDLHTPQITIDPGGGYKSTVSQETVSYVLTNDVARASIFPRREKTKTLATNKTRERGNTIATKDFMCRCRKQREDR